MTNTFNQSLVQFIQEPDNFLASLVLVNAFHTEPVLASQDPYAILLDGQKVIPVFTDETDYANFKETQASSQEHTWVERSALDLIAEARLNECAGLVFNLKKDGDAANTTIFPLNELVGFINQITAMMNQVMSDANQTASWQEKTYFVPAFIHPNEAGEEDRFFPSMMNEEKANYIPVFSSVGELAKWYDNPEFGGRFRSASGNILTWTLSEIQSPADGENEIDQTNGIVINPFGESQMVTWSDLAE